MKTETSCKMEEGCLFEQGLVDLVLEYICSKRDLSSPFSFRADFVLVIRSAQLYVS